MQNGFLNFTFYKDRLSKVDLNVCCFQNLNELNPQIKKLMFTEKKPQTFHFSQGSESEVGISHVHLHYCVFLLGTDSYVISLWSKDQLLSRACTPETVYVRSWQKWKCGNVNIKCFSCIFSWCCCWLFAVPNPEFWYCLQSGVDQ